MDTHDIDKKIEKNNKTIKNSKIVNLAVLGICLTAGILCACLLTGLMQFIIPIFAFCTTILTTRICTEINYNLTNQNNNLQSQKNVTIKPYKQENIITNNFENNTQPVYSVHNSKDVQQDNENSL